tara:strand:+ start:363 stop:803 length:441 start_codon:yes stop_codon:yes gene_type:complete
MAIAKDAKAVKKKGAVGRPNKLGRTGTWLGQLGENVRRARHKRAWSLTELSQHANVEMTLLSEFERGVRDISVSELLRVLKALGVSVKSLVPAKVPHVDVSVVATMSASWLAEACGLTGRNVANVLDKVSKDERATATTRKRNRAV